MYIKKLLIKKTVPKSELIREVNFTKGLNLIIDSNGSAKGNNVGKTTVLRVIDICLGAGNKKYIYEDAENKVVNKVLKDYINNEKITAELFVCKDLDVKSEAPNIVLEVELYSRGKKRIDGIVYTSKEYNEKLKKIFFPSMEDSNVTYRSLMKKFVRVDLKGDNNTFLKYLHQITNNITYRNVYHTLFDFNNSSYNNKKFEIDEDIKKLKQKIISLKNIHSFDNESELIQKKASITDNLYRLNNAISNLVDSKQYKYNEEKIRNIRVEYAKLQKKLEILNFEKERNLGILSQEKENQNYINEEILRDLYNETKLIYVDLDKEFKQLINFNHQVSQNKKNFYFDNLKKKELEINRCQEEIDELFENNKDELMLINSDNVEKYHELSTELQIFQEENGRIKELFRIYSEYKVKLDLLNEEKNSLKLDDLDLDAKLKIFNVFFNKYCQILSNENYLLYDHKEDDKFPFSLSGNKGSSFSTGTKKSTILAFDLAYISYSEHYDIPVPHFIIHDVLESMDERAFEGMINIISESNAQYIVAVLKEKIEKYSFINSDAIKLTLSSEDKLFKI